MKKSTSTKKASAKKSPAKKAAAKKSPAKKAAAKKAPAKKAAAKKAAKAPSPKKVAPKKAPSSKTIKQAKVSAEVKDAGGGISPKSGLGFSLDDVRRVLQAKASVSVTDSQAQKTKARKTAAAKKAKAKKQKFAAASVSDILGFNPKQRKTPEERREQQVPKKFLSYYRVLIKLRNELRDDLDSHSQGTLLTSSKEESGDLSSNSTDSGSESFDRDIALSMVASEQEALQEVDAAIDRIFDGTFGICQETGKPVKRDRLKAVPFTRFSLEGQIMHEEGSGRQVERGGIFTNLSESVPGMEPDSDT